MHIEPELRAQIESFIELAKGHKENKRLFPPKRNASRYKLDDARGWRFAHVWAGMFMFRVEVPTGDVYDGRGRRASRHGNIADLLEPKAWKDGSIMWDRNCVPVRGGRLKPCGLCGRTAAVRATALGDRCQYCRGADSRHIGAIRRLGGVPMLDGKPLGKYLKDD